mmetsp:Transcript_18108/g.42005  ORF Transcript_18108/g.42005 Transcript_18108/m.42005 type:complete len:362 (+) Transcript_18108:206-1291(+)
MCSLSWLAMWLPCLLVLARAINPQESTMRREVAPGDRSVQWKSRVSVQADGSTQPLVSSEPEVELEVAEAEDADAIEDDMEDECEEHSIMNASVNLSANATASNVTSTARGSNPDCRRRRSETEPQPGDLAWPGSLGGRRRCDSWCQWLCNGHGLQCRRRTILDWRRRSACWRRRQYTWRRRGTATGENVTEGGHPPPAPPCEYLSWRRRTGGWRRRTTEWRRRSTAIGEPLTAGAAVHSTKVASAASENAAGQLTSAKIGKAQETRAAIADHNSCWRRRTAEWRRRAPMWRRRWNCPGSDSTTTTTPCEPNGTNVDRGWGSPENIENAAPTGGMAEPALSAALQQEQDRTSKEVSARPPV